MAARSPSWCRSTRCRKASASVLRKANSRCRTTSTPATRKWRSCSWAESNLESASGYARRPVGNHGQSEAAAQSQRADFVAQNHGLGQRCKRMGNCHQTFARARRYARLQPGCSALLRRVGLSIATDRSRTCRGGRGPACTPPGSVRPDSGGAGACRTDAVDDA
ncbi:hypothetical protein ebA5955 [Aromatoleum aromaticum EbN1]|uniref:Uncharacterized protein n=1 Tax=Aromatoleum aromaticum (strain DSM 19018 / LMG 30748 / EbN1) TaxID=76114 RepID=Q5NZJ6_AROAE|nr:hypothetical protein ebA5955 [Aromatoleum aromaticum EbN1]